MRNIKLVIASCLLVLIAKGQPFGTTVYNGNSQFMCSGSICTASAGLMMAAYLPTTSNPGTNFLINRTDTGGTTGTGNSWVSSRTYTVNHAITACNGTQSQALFCMGVSLIETALTAPTRDYALAGATNKGVFYATLDAVLIPINTTLYRFPNGASSITQPLIVESTAGQEYFICGSYSLATSGAFMYLLKVDASGAILNSRTYQIASGIELIPRDLILSPYIVQVVSTNWLLWAGLLILRQVQELTINPFLCA